MNYECRYEGVEAASITVFVGNTKSQVNFNDSG
jgi:hypothetical protein